MQIDSDLASQFGGIDEIKARVVAFRKALEDHKTTVDVPAPVEADLIEKLARDGTEVDTITLPPPPPPPPEPPPPSYRDKRKAAYIAELGKVPNTNFENTTGDVLDILITQIEAMRAAAGVKATDEYAARIAKIGEIKQRFPKA